MRRLFVTLAVLCLLVQGSSAQIIMRPHPRRGGGAGSTLMNGLVSYWGFDDPDSLGFDSSGSNHLINNNSVISVAGKIDSAGKFVKTNYEYLNLNDNASLSFNNESFTVSAWIKLTDYTQAIIRSVIVKSSGTGAGNYEYRLSTNNQTKGLFAVSDGTNYSEVLASAPISDNNWHCLIGWYNADTDSVYLQVDNTIYKIKNIYGSRDGAGVFNIGSTNNNYSYCMDGLIDAAAIWCRCSTYTNGYAMADSIYNGGAGWCP